jgi:hypothetical protein
MELMSQQPKVERVVWWDVIDATTDQQMTTRKSEKAAYDAAAKLEKSHAVAKRNRQEQE